MKNGRPVGAHFAIKCLQALVPFTAGMLAAGLAGFAVLTASDAEIGVIYPGVFGAAIVAGVLLSRAIRVFD